MANVERRVFKRKLEKMKKSGRKRVRDEDGEREMNKEDEEVVDRKDSDVNKAVTDQADASERKKDREVTMGSILTSHSFDSLNISPQTRKAIAAMGFTRLTEIQHKCIEPLLQGR